MKNLLSIHWPKLKSLNFIFNLCKFLSLGNSRWVHAMGWSGQKRFGVAPGVYDARHMLPMDQPKAALSMLKRWTRGSLSKNGAEAESVVSSM
ncbi:putative carboxypeptidase C [Helianthus annuus]|uniref:Carboxypeptidase C n=1 Tax=Helianthus annuus TaxID=4232 RepID=A0A251U145_HELAN|nr:putative carboxypeptidase C [Helianthus annuus]KAJ0875887.1 putative carboxypeptidase C [Helianthus annuus]